MSVFKFKNNNTVTLFCFNYQFDIDMMTCLHSTLVLVYGDEYRILEKNHDFDK